MTVSTTTTTPRSLESALATALVPHASTDLPIRVEPGPNHIAERTAPPSLSPDEQMSRAVKLGALIGIPLVFLVTAAIGYLGGVGLGGAVAIGLWCGFFGNGMYLGGIAFLPSVPDEYPRSIHSAPSPTGSSTAPAPTSRTVS